MQRSFLSFSLLLLMLLGGLNVARATSLGPNVLMKDTIVVRLPNQATLTLVVRDGAQLRQMKNYHLDSLTSRLAGYIAQAELAAKNASTDQVTMQFYPDKDQPGKNLPEQIRITTRKKTPSNNRVDVMLNKAFGVVVTTDQDGSKSYNTSEGKSKEQRQAHRDSTRLRNIERKHTSSNLIFDLGLNAFVNQKQYLSPTGQPEAVDLRTEGSRYVNLGWDWDTRLGGKHSPVSITVGPQFAFNNFMLSGNNKWVSANGRTDVVHEADSRQLQKTKLATSSINLPLMLRLQLRDSHYKETFTIGAGGFIGYRIKSWTKLKYTNEGTVYKDKEDGSYNMENFLYGLQGTIGYGSMEFFAKYNMNQLFKTNAGPDTQVLSFGIRLFGN
ncbi:outer membrane beta-barrel protein [Hymenobacter sp. BT770]|uniref:outer membrane beta-barrel protein n=1 Tax=Hymenobacter sp. BT770 TaxID=2886942 RepID=UPI001D1258D1|nr:outer membrane beta-barrel protein [Hymenobacter sp. BT770]MCC3152947.1 PorT family protein [Hymenobacter sp. BT770]MDO3415139.1 outer membrane beta-barrel protein [Hymenobacter sp. BT770]